MIAEKLGQEFDHMALSVFQEELRTRGVALKAGCTHGLWYVEGTCAETRETLCGTGQSITAAICDAIWHQESTEKAE